MPKAKTNKSARKRFKLTAKGKVRRYRAFKGHLRARKSSKRKRAIRSTEICAPGDARVVKEMIRAAF